MSVIWKYPLGGMAEEYEVVMPEGAQVIHAGRQIDTLTLWALVPEAEVPMERRTFALRGTGHHVPEHAQHLRTWQDGPFVWHLFELHPTRFERHNNQGETDGK